MPKAAQPISSGFLDRANRNQVPNAAQATNAFKFTTAAAVNTSPMRKALNALFRMRCTHGHMASTASPFKLVYWIPCSGGSNNGSAANKRAPTYSFRRK